MRRPNALSPAATSLVGTAVLPSTDATRRRAAASKWLRSTACALSYRLPKKCFAVSTDKVIATSILIHGLEENDAARGPHGTRWHRIIGEATVMTRSNTHL